MQINRCLYLSSSPWGIPLHCDLIWKRIGPKNFLFIGINNWIVLAVRWSVCCSVFPNILNKACRKTRRRKRTNLKLQSIMRFTRDMVKQELQVTSWKLKSMSGNSKVRVQIRELPVWIHALRVWIHELRVQNSRVASSNPQVTSSNSLVASSNLRVTSSNPRVTCSNPRVTSSNPRVHKPLKTQWKLK